MDEQALQEHLVKELFAQVETLERRITRLETDNLVLRSMIRACHHLVAEAQRTVLDLTTALRRGLIPR